MNEQWGISVICWSNDLFVHNEHFGLTFDAASWYGYPDMDLIIILPHDKCRNLGEAYNLGRSRAKYPLRIYMHQDVQLMDRSLGLKLATLLDESTGIGAVGPLGAAIDTGGGPWLCHPKYQIGHEPDLTAKSLLMTSDCRPLKVLDGIFIATNQDIPWSEEYEGTHLFIEDYCMRIRARGLQIWGVDTFLRHKGGNTGMDDKYWRSNALFRRNWEHAFSNPVPPMDLFKAFYEQFGLDSGLVHRKVIEAGMYDIVWRTWAAKQANDEKAARKAEKEAAYA